MNNTITLNQWNEIRNALFEHMTKSGIPDQRLYSFTYPKQVQGKDRYGLYDDYDNPYSPGLDFYIADGESTGKIRVYSGSEAKSAPIDFKTALKVASEFFNDLGSDIAEEIVCDFVMQL